MSSRGSPRSPPAVPRMPSSSSSAFSKPVRKPSANKENTAAGQTRYQIPIFNSTSASVSTSTATTPSPASSIGSNPSSYPSPLMYGSTPPSRSLSSDGIDIRIQMEQGFLPYAALPVHTAEIVRTNVITGLPESEAQIRIKDLGRNSMPQPTLSVWSVVKEELTEPLILLLLAVAFLYSLWGKIEEALTAVTVVFLTVALELYTEWRAKVALLRLSTSAFQPPVTIVRGGAFLKKDKEEVVIGDICQISAGERIVADGRLLSCSSLLMDESMLTGESHPVSKEANITLPAGTPLTQRLNMVYAGTFVLHGSARYIVTATAIRTEMGMLSQLAVGAKFNRKRESRTALQVFLKELAVTLTFVAVVACMITMTLGFMRGFQYQIVVLMGLSLAFACVPEELPVLIKAVLAVSALQLSRKNVLVKSLRTAEALGSTSLLLTDKTGTLTRNELHLLRLSMAGKMLHVPRSHPEDEPNFAQGNNSSYSPAPITSSSASKSRPFKASTDDMLAFEPMLAQGWLLSSPGLIHTLLHSEASIYGAREAKKAKANSINGSQTYPTQTSVIAARAEEALLRASQSFPLIRDPLDSALLRFFFTRRSHPLDLNSAFLRRMLADALIASESIALVHVIPYDPIRRRSSTLRRMNQSPSATSSEHQSLFPTEQISLEDNSSPEEAQTQASAAAAVPLRLLTRGGGECVLSICTYAVHSSLGIIKLTPAVRDDLEREMRIMAETGVRVMGFAVRSIEEKQVEKAFSIAAKSVPTPKEPTAPIAEAEAIRTDQPTVAPSSPNSTATASNASLPSSPLVVLERGMTFLGFVGLGDVLRPGVGRTIHQLQRAGVEVKIVTGDFQHTGAAVAKAVGVLPVSTAQASSSSAEKARRANLKKKAQDAARVKAAMPKPTMATGTPTTPTRHNGSGLYVDSTGILASPDEIEGVLVGPLRPKLAISARRSQAATPTANDDSPRTPTRIVTPIPERPSPIVGVFNPPQAMGLSRSRNTSANDLQRLLLPQALHVDLSAKVYTRMTPNDKLAIVLAHQRKGARVLVSGDGANDAAALAAADAGLAMGSSKAGTDLAREMAGLILVNDDFHGVYIAIREGRRALENLSKALRFYLACKCALVFLFVLPLACGFDLPLAPLQIIILEAFLDLGATAAFTYEIAESNLMKRPPSDWAREKYMKGKRVMLEIASAAMLLLSTLLVTLFLAYHIRAVHHAASLHANEMFPLQLNALPLSETNYQSYANVNTANDSNSTATSSYHRTWSNYWNLLEVYAAAAASPSSSSIAPASGSPPAGTTPLSSPPSTSSSHTESHSSSSFFPSILPTYTHDSHLFLTHSIMLVCWLITTVLLANFMRSSSRSYVFACCDRRSLQVLRERRRRKRREEVRATRRPGDLVSPMPIDSASSLAAAVSAQSSYASLSSVESGLPKPRSEERVDRVGVDNSPNWLGSSSGDSTDTDTTDEEGEDDVEGLLKQRRSAYLEQQNSQLPNGEHASGAALLFEEEYGGLFEEVFPLLANPLMLVWAILSVIFAYAAITNPWMRGHLHLSDMNVLVLIPVLFGSHRTVPAYAVAIIPALIIFFVAELCKFVYSFRHSSTSANLQTKSVPVEGQYETLRGLGVRGAHPKKMRNNEPYTVYS